MLAVVIAVMVIAASLTVVLAYTNLNGQSVSTTYTTTSVADVKNDLNLQLSLNASSSASAVMVSVTVAEYNPLASTNNVPAAVDWLVALNYLDGAPCGDDGSTVGFAIAEGYYASSNVTTAKFLDLVNPGATYNCPLYLGYGNPTGYAFRPMSDMATEYGCTETSPCLTGSASTGLTPSLWGPVTGYWEGATFTSFARGIYTVLAEDGWDNSVLAYFAVS
jgi:hypothetical protein